MTKTQRPMATDARDRIVELLETWTTRRLRCSNCGQFKSYSDCMPLLYDGNLVALYHPYRFNPELPCGPVRAASQFVGSSNRTTEADT